MFEEKIGLLNNLIILKLKDSDCSNYFIKYFLYHLYEKNKKDAVFNFSFSEVSKIYNIKKVYERYDDLLKQINYKTKLLTFTTKKRLISGVGIHSPIEIGFSINPHLGIPYIPASSIKGVLRKYCEEKSVEKTNIYFGEKENEENSPGNIIFLDAYPDIQQKSNILRKDLLAPRFSEYYSNKGNKAPIESKTNIIPFLTINTDVKFFFLIASKEQEYLDEVTKYLEELLINKGIGAKTNVGYGKFKKK